MRRLATLDRVLLATLVPLWIAVFALHVRQVVLTGLAEPPVYAWASREPDGYPTVGAFRPELHGRSVGLEIGDRLLRVGDVDLRGAGYLRFYAATLAETDAALQVPVVFERDGEQRTLAARDATPGHRLVLDSRRCSARRSPPCSCCCARPTSSRRGCSSSATMTFITFCTPFHGQSYSLSYLSRGVLWYGARRRRRSALVWLWVICFPGECRAAIGCRRAGRSSRPPIWYLSRINYVTPGFPRSVVPALKGTCDAFLMGGGLAIATRNYRRGGPIGRRRVKWLLYGAYIAVVPLIVARTLTIIDPDARWYEWVYVVTIIGMVGVPARDPRSRSSATTSSTSIA